MLVTVAIMGILATTLSAAILVVIRNIDATTQRIASSTDEQNLVTWLPVDISSAPATNLSTERTAVSGCVGPSPGESVLLLWWEETINGTTTGYRANYRAVPEGLGIRLYRYTCSGAGALPLGAAATLHVSNQLRALPPGWAPGQVPVKVTVSGPVVSFDVTEDDGRIVHVDSAHKNPADTLPPPPTTAPATTTASTSTTTTATTTTTSAPATTTTVFDPSATTVAPTIPTTAATTTTTTIPCVVATVSVASSPAATHSKAPNTLQNDVVVTITTTGPCRLLQLRYDSGGSQGLFYQNFSTTTPSKVTLHGFRSSGTEIWSAGAHELSVIDGDKTVLNTANLTVT